VKRPDRVRIGSEPGQRAADGVVCLPTQPKPTLSDPIVYSPSSRLAAAAALNRVWLIELFAPVQTQTGADG